MNYISGKTIFLEYLSDRKTCYCSMNNICKLKRISSLLLNAMESSIHVFVFVVDIYLKRDTVVNVVVST